MVTHTVVALLGAAVLVIGLASLASGAPKNDDKQNLKLENYWPKKCEGSPSSGKSSSSSKYNKGSSS